MSLLSASSKVWIQINEAAYEDMVVDNTEKSFLSGVTIVSAETSSIITFHTIRSYDKRLNVRNGRRFLRKLHLSKVSRIIKK